MALLHVNFASQVLGCGTSMYVILPEEKNRRKDGKWPTLYLLHGYSGDDSDWQRQTSVERYVAEQGIAVVMPCVHNGFYTNMAHGDRFWDFVSEELPALCERMFPLSAKREDRFAAGLSMGGYGALKLGLRLPERYAAVASLSGVVDLAAHVDRTLAAGEPWFLANVFGSPDALRGSENDLVALAKKHMAAGTENTLPAMYIACGTEDFLYPVHVSFRSAFEKPLKLTCKEGPGAHTWAFWDEYIQYVLAWLPVRR